MLQNLAPVGSNLDESCFRGPFGYVLKYERVEPHSNGVIGQTGGAGDGGSLDQRFHRDSGPHEAPATLVAPD